MMNKFYRYWACSIIVFTCCLSEVLSQQTNAITLQLGVAMLSAEPLTSKNAASYISTQLLENLASYIIFPIDNSEMLQNIMIRNHNKKIAALQKELGLLKEKIDAAALINDKAKQKKTYDELIKSFEQKKASYELLLQLSSSESVKLEPAKISVAKTLFTIKTESPDTFSIQNKLDFLVFGTIKIIDSLFLVTINVYSANSESVIYTTTIIGDEQTIIKKVADKSLEIAETIVGKEICVIEFTGSPANASICINNETLTSHTYVCLDPQSISITIHAQGYTNHKDELSLQRGERYIYTYELKPVPLKTLSIVTIPESADIFLNSIPIGISPLQLEVNPEQDTITAHSKGYNAVQVSLTTVQDELTITMTQSTGKSFDETFEDAKSRFYKSLGWFVISLPFSTLSYGSFMAIYQTELELQLKLASGQITLAEAVFAEQELGSRFWFYQSAFWISLAISSGLGINAIINLIHYITSM